MQIIIKSCSFYSFDSSSEEDYNMGLRGLLSTAQKSESIVKEDIATE